MFDKYKPHLEKIKETTQPVFDYVYNRRGRFSALSTVIVLYPLIRRPNHTWAEFEKDFRMYDEYVGK